MPLRSEVVFSDIPINLTAHPISGDLVRKTNADAVKRSVKNLVLSKYYERPFKPFLGSNVTAYLFENFDALTEENVRDGIEEVIINHEKRAELIDIRVKGNPDNNGLDVTIIFRVVNQTEPVELDIFLERVR